MSEERFGWVGVALGAAAGFLAGVLLVVALGGGTTDPPAPRTVTVAPSAGPGATVITRTAVPDVTGDRLDIAKERVRRAGFLARVKGGGLLGVIREQNWSVAAEDPPPGQLTERGSTVTLNIERG